MNVLDVKRFFCVDLGQLLEYPGVDYESMPGLSSREIENFPESVKVPVKEFLDRMRGMDLIKRQEYYVQTFDLTPHCSMYLSVHLFGEESFKRPELMVGLKSSYQRNGLLDISELPDHLAVILKYNEALTPEEWSELVSMCLLPMMPKMIAKFEKWNNPHALVLKAIQALLMEMETSHV